MTERAAVAYCRVSTDERPTSGLGLDTQREAVRRYAAAEGLRIVAEFTDAGISGSAGLEDRPGLAEALDRLDTGDTLLVAKRGRLGRDVMPCGWLELEDGRRGADIRSAAGDGNGDDSTARLMRTLVDAFAECGCGVIRARTRAALTAKPPLSA